MTYLYVQHVISMPTQPVNLQTHPAFTEEKASHQQSGKTNTSHNEITCGFDKQCCTQNFPSLPLFSGVWQGSPHSRTDS